MASDGSAKPCDAVASARSAIGHCRWPLPLPLATDALPRAMHAMPDVRPFRGVRYDIAQVGALSDVVAPPYDVIDPALQDRLYQASPYNVIRLELNRAEPGDSDAENRYTRAAGFLKDWLREGVLREDRRPSGALRLPPDVRGRGPDAHPQGLPGPGPARAVRPGADLSRTSRRSPAPRPTGWPSTRPPGSTSARSSGSTPTPSNEVLRAVEAGLRDRTPLEATDHLGVVNRLWLVTDPETHTAVQGLMAARPIFIADGHHRYETGLKYRDDLGRSRRV